MEPANVVNKLLAKVATVVPLFVLSSSDPVVPESTTLAIIPAIAESFVVLKMCTFEKYFMALPPVLPNIVIAGSTPTVVPPVRLSELAVFPVFTSVVVSAVTVRAFVPL